MLIIFSMLIYGVRLATSSGSPRAATHLPLKGKARGKAFFLPDDFYCQQFSDPRSVLSRGV